MAKDEDPFAGLGSGVPLGQAQVAGAPQPRTQRPDGRREGPLLVVWMIFTLAVVFAVVLKVQHDEVNNPMQKAQRGEITATSADSLLQPSKLSRALKQISGKAGSEAATTSLRVDATSVDATVRDANGDETIYRIDPSFNLSTSSFGSTTEHGAQLSRVDPRAPQRILAAAKRREGRAPDTLDYMVFDVSSIDGSVMWNVFYTGGRADRRQFFADARGRDVHRPGEASQAERRRQTAQVRCLGRAQTAQQAARCTQ